MLTESPGCSQPGSVDVSSVVDVDDEDDEDDEDDVDDELVLVDAVDHSVRATASGVIPRKRSTQGFTDSARVLKE